MTTEGEWEWERGGCACSKMGLYSYRGEKKYSLKIILKFSAVYLQNNLLKGYFSKNEENVMLIGGTVLQCQLHRHSVFIFSI